MKPEPVFNTVTLEVPLDELTAEQAESLIGTAQVDEPEASTSDLHAHYSGRGRRPLPGKAPRKGRKRVLDKESEEYKARRERNNVAVRKSRDKAKIKHKETEQRVDELTAENDRLNKKCDLLTKELNVLKGLFSNIGANLPPEFKAFMVKHE